MAREGLFDDNGYDFFDTIDCSHYESCVEEEYNRGFEEAIEECIYSVEEVIEQMGLVDATKYGNETKEQRINSYSTMMRYEIANYFDDLLDELEQLKEQENG